MGEDVRDITIKITKHVVDRMRGRDLSNRADIETHLKDILLEHTIKVYESRYQNSFIYVYAQEEGQPMSIIVFIELENSVFLASTAYRSFPNLSNKIVHRFFVKDIILPIHPKSDSHKIEEQIEDLEDKKKVINHQIVSMQLKVEEIDQEIYALECKKEEVSDESQGAD